MLNSLRLLPLKQFQFYKQLFSRKNFEITNVLKENLFIPSVFILLDG